jgi:hypothetical protein
MTKDYEVLDTHHMGAGLTDISTAVEAALRSGASSCDVRGCAEELRCTVDALVEAVGALVEMLAEEDRITQSDVERLLGYGFEVRVKGAEG